MLKAIGSLSRLIDRKVWTLVDGDAEVLHQRHSRPFKNFLPPSDNGELAAMIAARALEVHHEHIHRLQGDLYIDPHSGFVIRDQWELIGTSLSNVEQAGRPSVARWKMARAGLAPLVKMRRCISSRDVFETNYFHFFNEVLTKIPLLEDAGLLDVPIVVGHGAYCTPFFQSILPKLTKAGIKVIDQGNAFIQCEEIVQCRTIPFDRGLYDRVMDLLEIGHPEDQGKGRRIFLTRGKGSRNKRTLGNEKEVHHTIRDHGIEIHDPATLSLEEQIELLSGTSLLIGLHGAGLTNMIFRRDAPMIVLEIFPADHIPPHYFWLSQMYGHEHRSLIAGRTDARGSFEVPIGELKKALDSFCDSRAE